MTGQSPEDFHTLPPPDPTAVDTDASYRRGGAPRRTFWADVPPRVVATVIRLFLLSVVVGWIISVLDLSIQGFFSHLARAFDTVCSWARWLVEWTLPYASVGAVVVVPLWLASVLIRLARRRGPGLDDGK